MTHELPQPNQVRSAIIVPASRVAAVDKEAGRRYWQTIASLNRPTLSQDTLDVRNSL